MSVTWTVSQTDQTWKYIKTFTTEEENESSMKSDQKLLKFWRQVLEDDVFDSQRCENVRIWLQQSV